MSAVPSAVWDAVKAMLANPANSGAKPADLVQQALDMYRIYLDITDPINWATYVASAGGLVNRGGQGAKVSVAPTTVKQVATDQPIGGPT